MADPHLLTRWTIFNTVGALGIGVQLAALAVLVEVLGLRYLPATALAVEAAILHNFAWHQRWTWRDRPASGVRDVAWRLVRFHLANGLVSIAGNLVLMAWLSGSLGLHPVLANAIAIAACSVLNFAAGARLVFRTAPSAVVLLALAAPDASAAGPSPEALSAWRAYEATVDARYAAALRAGEGGPVFFAQDAQGAGWRQEALRGAVTVRGLNGSSVPGGTIFHVAGAVFIPGTSVGAVLARLQGLAGAEERYYDDVVASRLLSREGGRLRVYLKLRRTAVITAVYNTEHDVEYRRIGARRGASRSVATRIAEVADAGTARERERSPGEDRGFLWRLNAYWRYEETGGGVLVECESVSLSRGLPALARPVASPIAARIARESLERTLRSLRAAVSGIGNRESGVRMQE